MVLSAGSPIRASASALFRKAASQSQLKRGSSSFKGAGVTMLINDSVDYEDLEPVGDSLEDEDRAAERAAQRAERAEMIEKDLAVLRPMDALALSVGDLLLELEQRGVRARGFFQDDARDLQVFYDKEHVQFVIDERVRKLAEHDGEVAQMASRRKKLVMDGRLREEMNALETEDKLLTWVTRLRDEECVGHARIETSPVGTRCIAKALRYNESLTSLEMSRIGLTDHCGQYVTVSLLLLLLALLPVRPRTTAPAATAPAGTAPNEPTPPSSLRYLARALRETQHLLKLELDGNQLGPKTCFVLGDSLCTNGTLASLSIESNPLTGYGGHGSVRDRGGLAALARALSKNRGLTHLNVWRTGLDARAGALLASGIGGNTALVSLELGNNDLDPADEASVAQRLEENRRAASEARRSAAQEAKWAATVDAEAHAEAERQAKTVADAEWIEMRRRQRVQRRKEEEEAKLKADADAHAARELEEVERKERLSKPKGKKGKKKGKGKKKKK